MLYKNRLMLLRSASLVVAMSTSGLAYAGPGVWTTSGPYGGSAQALAIDPATPTIIYVGTSGAGIFKSTDGGGAWEPANTGIVNLYISVVAIDPTRPSTLYAGAFAFFGGPAPVFKSTDSGGSWAVALWAPGGVAALAIDPSEPSLVYAGTHTAGVFKSTNSGTSWEPANTGMASLAVLSLAIDPAADQTLYAGTGGGIFKSTNAGGSWIQLNSDAAVRAWAIDPVAPSTVFAATSSQGVLKSTDGGGSWTPLAAGPQFNILALAIDPTTPATLYVTTLQSGIFKSTDAGATWVSVNTGLANWSVWTIAIDPTSTATLYAGTTGSGVVRSTDFGASWAVRCTGITNLYVFAMAIDPAAPATYAATEAGVFKSTDFGGSWIASNAGFPDVAQTLSPLNVKALAIALTAPTTLYSGVFGTGVFRSTDSGGSWAATSAALTDLRQVQVLAVSPVTPTTVYAGTYDAGVFKSTNSGATWAAANTGLTSPRVNALVFNPVTSATLYAATAGGLFKSTDSGSSWIIVLAASFVNAVAVDPSLPNTIYSGTNAMGILKSTNAGATWVAVDPGPPNHGITALTIDPTTPPTLYAATTGGVFRSTNAGASWKSVNAGLPPQFGTSFVHDHSHSGIVYSGIASSGVWQASPPPVFVKGDLNSDGLADMVFRSDVDGAQNKVWFMDGVTRTAEAVITPDAASADWKIRGVDDFDFDGKNDLVFWNQATGNVEFWLMNGTTRVGVPVPLTGGPVLDPGWDLSATADFNHDGSPDIVWRNFASQKIVVWTMNGTTKSGTVIPTPSQAVDANWIIVGALDYNNDGNTDFLWYNFTSGKLVTWYMDASVVRTTGQFTTPSAAGDANWKVVASSDYSREYVPGTPPLGSPDIVWRNETSGSQVIWHMDFGSTRVHGQFTNPAANTPALDWTIVGPR